MTIEEAKAKAIALAESQVGYHEKASNKDLDGNTNNGSNNYTKYARDLDAIGYYNGKKNGPSGEWCDIFYDWVIYTAFKKFGLKVCQSMLYQPAKSLGAGTYYSEQYYRQHGAFYKTPELADQIFFNYGSGTAHTGMVVKITDFYVYTVEGNSQNEVQRKKYARNNTKIEGYGRPNWKLVADSEPAPAPVKPMLRKGDSGPAVKDLQEALIAHGYKLPRYGADGDFGSETDAAVRAYQRDHKLEVDGIVGPKTWASLEATKPVVLGDGIRYKLYTVKAGDTLTKIATAHNVNRQSIILLNDIKDPNLIRVGQVLKIPV